MIRYLHTADNLSSKQLKGFFEGWADSPSSETHLKLLKSSDEIVLAIDAENDKVVGFITAITDHVMSAYIPFLEVLPDYRQRGIGRELVRQLLKKLGVMTEYQETFLLPAPNQRILYGLSCQTMPILF